MGAVVGSVEGSVVGAVVGSVEGSVVGAVVGSVEGAVVGAVVGSVGSAVVGVVAGAVEGVVVGTLVGSEVISVLASSSLGIESLVVVGAEDTKDDSVVAIVCTDGSAGVFSESALGSAISVKTASKITAKVFIFPVTYFLRKDCHFSIGATKRQRTMAGKQAKLGILPKARIAKKATRNHKPIVFSNFIVHTP